MECDSCEIVKDQAQTIVHLQSRITELEARLGLNSGNSNFPSSRDIFSPPKSNVVNLTLRMSNFHHCPIPNSPSQLLKKNIHIMKIWFILL